MHENLEKPVAILPELGAVIRFRAQRKPLAANDLGHFLNGLAGRYGPKLIYEPGVVYY